MYSLIRSLLFCLEPERSHALAMHLLRMAKGLHLGRQEISPLPRAVFGLTFKNPVGLAAGFDKNGDYLDVLGPLGFGFIEIGTVTPKAQEGNPKPRLFRLPQASALINRMGFNNKGIDYLIERVKASKYDGVLGINIGKNATTALDNAFDDYALCFQKAYPYADYIAVNISSPNTKDLRQLQQENYFASFVKNLKQLQAICHKQHHKYVPLLIKVAPDLTEENIVMMADVLRTNEIDGLIATNTTTSRHGVAQLKHGGEAGGLSGLPLAKPSTDIIRLFHRELKNEVAIIGVGGIMNANLAQEKLFAGASLVQIYTGFIYQGPALIAEIVKALQAAQFAS